MSEEILIELIKTNRKVARSTDVEDLVNEIEAEGLKVPVLVDRHYNLIDGLRRIEAMMILGGTKIQAVVAETYDEAISNLKLAHQGRSGVGPKRTWELTLSLNEMMWERTRKLRARYASVPINRRGTVAKEPRSRELFRDALNDTNAYKYGQIYRAAASGHTQAQELVKAMEAGEIPASTAISRMEDRSRIVGNVTSLSEQRVLLESATMRLSGLVKGLEKLATPIRLPKNELDEIVKQLKIHRAALTVLVRSIEKESLRK